MNLDCALILAAGFGTRMGELGKIIPKPLWPLFDSTLLGWQISFLKSLGIQRIYVNTHHHAKELENYLSENFPDVNILYEPEILDVGGAIHNLARQINYQGNLFVVNSDVMFNLSDVELDNGVNKLKDHDVILYGLKVDKASGLNEIIIEDNVIVGIVKNNDVKESEYITYSGFCLVNMSCLAKVDGVSNFFESVVSFQNKNSGVYITSNIPYLDFGTLSSYFESCYRVVGELKENDHFPINKAMANRKSYNGTDGVLNFTGTKLEKFKLKNGSRAIVFHDRECDSLARRVIVSKDLVTTVVD